MPFPNGYKDKHGTYYVRYVFDADSRVRIGFLPRDIRLSLRTKNRREAAFRVRWFLFEMDCLLVRLKSMDDQDKQQREFERQGAEFRASLERKESDLPVDTARKVHEQMLESQIAKKLSESQQGYADRIALDADTINRVTKLQAEVLGKLAQSKGVDVSDQVNALRERASSNTSRAIERVKSIDEQAEKNAARAQQLSGEIPTIVLQNMIESEYRSVGKARFNERLSTIAEDFFIEKDDDRRNEKDRRALRRHVTQFIQLLDDPIVRDITTTMLREARRKCKLLPPEQKKKVKGKTAPQMLALGMAPRSLQTTNNQLSSVRTFFRWAKEQRRTEHDDSGIIKDFESKNKREESERRSWQLEELQQLFNSYIYRYDMTAVGKGHGNEEIAEGNFWIPLIGLYTGARLEEICSLKPEHIVEVQGVWCFDMVEFDEDGNPIKKNKSSVRVFPIHQKLIDFGLVEYAEKRLKESRKMLFDLQFSEGKWSHSFSKWFNRTFKEKIGFNVGKNIEKSEVVFHSFRNNIVDEFETAMVAENTYSRITGHSTGGVAKKTYSFKGKKIFPPKPLVNVVNAVEHDGLDLTHISFEGFNKRFLLKKRQSRQRRKDRSGVRGQRKAP